MAMPRLFFEDFTPGLTQVYGPVQVSRDDIIAFAREYDPQPFHIDEVAAKNTFVGALIASGWHSCSILMRLIAEGFLLDASSMGAPGVEFVKWVQPVRPGDTLRAKVTVLESKASKSRPTIGLVRFHFELLNQSDEVVLVQSNWIMFGRRDAPWPPAPVERPTRPAVNQRCPEGPALAPISSDEVASPYLEDLVPGRMDELGSYTFTADRIIHFAKQFDPQPFHLDEEAARRSLFGGLCASGWHTASVWMKLILAYRDVRATEARRRGERPAQLGPSPGFKNLKWLKPVYAGDTLTYRATLIDKRVSASRPGWGIASHRHTAENQHGECVFEFEGTVFWERRPGS